MKGRILRTNPNPIAIYTDNPKADAAFAINIFGKGVSIRRDIFYALLDYFKGCRAKSPHRESFMGEISKCFYIDSAEDRQKVLDYFVYSGIFSKEKLQNCHNDGGKKLQKVH